MKDLTSVMGVIEIIANVAAYSFCAFWAVHLIGRLGVFSKCAKQYKVFINCGEHKTAYGKVVSRKALLRNVLIKSIFEIKVAFTADGEEYEFTKLSVGKMYPLNDPVEVEYNANSPEIAEIKDGTDVRKYESCISRTKAEIVFLAVALLLFAPAIHGIIYWIEYIIRYVSYLI